MRALAVAPTLPGRPSGGTIVRPRLIGAAALAFVVLALLVQRFDAPLILGAVVFLAGGVALLLRPEVATLIVAFLLYTNIPVLAYRYHGVPQPVAGAFILLLLLPFCHHLIVRRERARTDGVLFLMLVFLVVLLVAAIGAKGPETAAARIVNYTIEGILLYWLVVNSVRTIATLRRVIWSLLAAGSLLASLSLYQEITGSFDQQFGGLAHRNYAFIVVERQLELNPDDPELLQLKASMKNDRSSRAEGPMDEPNTYGQIMLVLLPLAMLMYRSGQSGRNRILAATAALLILGGMLISQSRGALVGLGVVAIAAAYLRWIRPAHLVLCTMAGLVVVPLVASDRVVERFSRMATAIEILQGSPGVESDPAIEGRATEMLAAFQAFVDHPILGVGPGQYAPYYSVEYHQKNPRFKFKDLRITRRAHSLYLEMAAEVGIVGLSVFLAIVFVVMRSLLRARSHWIERRADLADLATAMWLSVAAYLATGMFLHLMYERYFWLLLALASAAIHVMRSQTESAAPPGGPATRANHRMWVRQPVARSVAASAGV